MIAGHLVVRNGYYNIVLSYTDSKGKRRQPWIKTDLKEKGNKKAAQELLMEYRRTFVPPAEDVLPDQINSNMLFSDFLVAWLDIIKSSVETTTYASYAAMVKQSIVPHFEKTKITVKNLSPMDLQTYYNKCLKTVSSNTVIHRHRLIHKALKYLVQLDIIPSNPSDKVIPPKRTKYVAEYYNQEDLMKLFEVIKGHPMELLIKMTAFYGLRRSEVVGLKWKAIDFEANTLTIKHIVTAVNLDGKRTLVKADRAKTKSSLRTMPLIGDIKEELLALKEQQALNRKICGNSYIHENDEYVFVDAMGKLYKPDLVTANFRQILKSNDLKVIRFHDLRHSCATLLFANEVPMKLIQEWLGHSDIGTTANIYSHVDFRSKLMSASVITGALGTSKDQEDVEDKKKGRKQTPK